MALSMLPVVLDPRGRRLVVGRGLWLLSVAWPSGQSSAMSAGKPAVLVVAASVPATDSSPNADTDSSGPMLVLHQWPGYSDDARGMSGARRSMLSDARRSAQTLQRSLLVLHQWTHRPGQRGRMQRARRAVLLVQRGSAPALRTIVLVLHQRPGRAGSGGRLPGTGWSMFWFQRRSVEELSPTANADSAAATNTDSAAHLYSRH